MAGKNRQFPHLLPDDIDLWERFLASSFNTFDRFEYDIRVGTGRDPGDSFPDNIRKMGIDLSQRRIDAVGFRPGRITVIEITTSAGLKAIGQLRAYPELYRMSFAPADPVFPLLIAETIETDVLPVLAMDQVDFLVFPLN